MTDPFPSDVEIRAAIRLLARANVLREYYVRHAVANEMAAQFAGHADGLRSRIEEECQLLMAKQLVAVLARPPWWTSEPDGFHRCQVCESSGWVISYADVRRALESKP